MSADEQARKQGDDISDAEVLEQVKGLPNEIALGVLDMYAGLRHRQYEATCELDKLTRDYTYKSGASAINVGLVINGGAAVALLALIGHLAASSAGASRFTVLTEPLSYFSAGVFLNALARGADYFAGMSVVLKREGRRRFFYALTIFLIILCLLAFPLGCWRTAVSLLSLTSHKP